MRYVLFALVALFVASIIANGMSSDADAKITMHREEQQAKLDTEQRQILTRLEAKNDAIVSEFVRDWRRSYPSATPSRLEELQLIEQKINNDISSARQYTLASAQIRADKLNAAIQSPLGAKAHAKPGL